VSDVVLETRDLVKYFPLTRGILFKTRYGDVKAVDGVSFALREQEVLGLVGESGCGKTTTGRSILRLYDPTDGEIWFRTEEGERIEIAKISQQEMKPLRREMRMIFQDPFSSLDPRMTVRDLIAEPLVIHNIASGRELDTVVADNMKLVGLDPNYMQRYPHQFSGGQRQRIGLARTLSLNPRLIIADEPVSALDVSVQAQVLNLMQELKERLGLTMLFIAHDLSVVEHVRPYRRDVCRQNRRAGRGRDAAETPAAPLHRGADLVHSAGRPRYQAGADYALGRNPQPGQPAIGLLLPPALPLRRRYLQDRSAPVARYRQ